MSWLSYTYDDNISFNETHHNITHHTVNVMNIKNRKPKYITMLLL